MLGLLDGHLCQHGFELCQNGVPGKDGLAPETANHAVSKYLTVLDDAALCAANACLAQVHLARRTPPAQELSLRGGHFVALALDAEQRNDAADRLEGYRSGIMRCRSRSMRIACSIAATLCLSLHL